jgi:hypothetical protein
VRGQERSQSVRLVPEERKKGVTDLLTFVLLLHHLVSPLDRTTAIGTMIDSYLSNNSEVDDKAIHLLFSANRWEAR